MTYNLENARELAALIRGQKHTSYDSEDGFNMARVSHNCGSPCCIGGFAQATAKEKGIAIDKLDYAYARALQLLLGLSMEEAVNLFHGTFSNKQMQLITPDEAADAILAAVGLEHEVKA